MKILLRILALFLIMPVIELALLVYVAGIIDFWPTIAIILVTGLVGGFMAKREGISVWNRLQDRLNEGGMPGKELLDGVIILMAGTLLITPGVITDVVGFLGLLPPSRALIRKFLVRKFKQKMRDGTIQTSFGAFGTASWEHHSTGEDPFSADGWDDDANNSWTGEGTERPGYVNESDYSAEDDDIDDTPPPLPQNPSN